MVVVNREIIAQIMKEGYMMPAVKTELSAFQVGYDPPEDIRFLIKLFLLSGHLASSKKKKPIDSAKAAKRLSR